MKAVYPLPAAVRLWAATFCLFALSLSADTDDERRLRLRDQIQSMEKVLAEGSKGGEKSRLQTKLDRMRTELGILEERARLDEQQEALRHQLPSTPLQQMREQLREVEFTVSELETHIQDLNTQRRRVASERDTLSERLRQLSAASETKPEERTLAEESLFTLNERMRSLALAREAADARLELAREAERLRALVKEYEGQPTLTLQALHASYTQFHAGVKNRQQAEAALATIEENLKVSRANAELGRQKVGKYDEELALLEKQTGFFRTDPQVNRLLTIQRNQKNALVERLPLLQAQVEALERQAAALREQLALQELETLVRGERFAQLKEGYLRKLQWPGLSLLGLLLVFVTVQRVVLPLAYRKENLLLARRLTRYGTVLLGAGILAAFLFEDLTMVAATLGVVSAALVIALQDVCTSVAGWFVIMLGNKFSIGDRLEVDGSTGDVIDIQLLRTTLIEVGQWVESDQPTGRVIVIPNHFIFKGKVHNYSHHHSFIWDQITLTVAFCTPIAEAMELFHRVLAEETREEFAAAASDSGVFRQRYGVDDAVYTPRISTAITSDGVALRLTFVAHYRRQSAVRNRIHRRLIAELEHHPKIQLANTTYNILHAPLSTDAPSAIMGDAKDLASRPPFGFSNAPFQQRPPILPGR